MLQTYANMGKSQWRGPVSLVGMGAGEGGRSGQGVGADEGDDPVGSVVPARGYDTGGSEEKSVGLLPKENPCRQTCT
ncbi:MAG TPA: hypothetical protein VGM31_01790 [Puia sp.]